MGSYCVDELLKFLGRVTPRPTLSALTEAFRDGFEENPVFKKLFESGAHAKNLIILVGSSGTGKTTTLAYLKHLLERDGWRFVYYSGRELGDDRVKSLDKELSEVEESVRRGGRVVLAFDDVVEATPLFAEFVRANLSRILLAEGVEGSTKLVLAVRSESPRGDVGAVEWLDAAVGLAVGVNALLGEDPGSVLRSAVEGSYAERAFVKTFRGASVVNLDAFWARYRDLNAVPDLGEAMISILDFYTRNAGLEGECADLHSELEAVSKGLALLALARLPSLSSRSNAIVEHGEWGLNPATILKILLRASVDRQVYAVAKALSDLYDGLSKTEVRSLEPRDVVRAVVRACGTVRELGYSRSLRSVLERATPDVLGLYDRGGPARGRRGPEFALVHVSRAGEGTREAEDRYVVLTYISTDSRGYVRTGDLSRVKKLASLGVPRASEGRYLAVVIPSKHHYTHVYRAVRMDEVGRSVFVFPAESLRGVAAAFVSRYAGGELLKTAEELGIPAETSEDVLGRAVFSTLALSLRDSWGRPVLAELLLPRTCELGKAPEL